MFVQPPPGMSRDGFSEGARDGVAPRTGAVDATATPGVQTLSPLKPLAAGAGVGAAPGASGKPDSPSAADYVDDVSYLNLFHRHATPAWLHFVAGGLGYAAPDPAAALRWCELGCGPGYGTVLTAAAYPKGRFIGVDFNASHIKQARALATEAGVSNARFLERDLQSLVGGGTPRKTKASAEGAANNATSSAQPAGDADADLTQDPDFVEGFDFISVVGVYAWVAPADREAILRFVGRFLKPGGMLYLTYSCHPGMSWFVGMQRLLTDYAATVPGASSDKVLAALRFLKELASAQGSRLVEHPAQLTEIARALEADPRYLAHEFMAPHWTPQHVSDVIGDLAALGCTWLGSAQPGDNIDEFSIAPALRPLLASLPAGPLRETARALSARQSMRHDIFMRQAKPLSEDAHRQVLMDQRLIGIPGQAHALLAHPDARLRPNSPWGGVLAPALQVLDTQGSQSFAQLARHAHFSSRVGILNPVFQLLVDAGVAHPMQTLHINSRRAQAFNLAITEAILRGQHYEWLAAPAIGSAIRVEPWLMALANALLTSPALRWDELLQAVAARLDQLRALPGQGAGSESRKGPTAVLGQGMGRGPVLPDASKLSDALRDAMRNVVPVWRTLGVIAG